MKLILGIHNLTKVPNGCVLTIGNFDGVHCGHQALLRTLKKESYSRKVPVIVIIFEPQPLEFFAGKREAPARLMCLREKLCYLSQYKVDYVFCIRFDRRFASITAKDFIDNFLVKYLGVRFLSVGDDFRFGTNRKGNFSLLKQAGLEYGFDIANNKTFYKGNIRVSSTAIRQALAENKLDVAENLLGHPFTISGRVIHGDGLGRTIGFPTANLVLRRQVSPVKGIYAVEVAGLSKILLPGIANIGTRPTVAGIRQQLEVHLLGTVLNLYGQHINVILRKKIRDEQRFSSLEELKAQIIRDELTAQGFFKL